MSNWEDKFIEGTAVFGSLLAIHAKQLPEAIGQLNTEKARIILQQVRASCDEFEKILNSAPPRVLSPEEYKAKVDAGKKVTLTKGGIY